MTERGEGFTPEEVAMLDQTQASMREVRHSLEAMAFRWLYGFDANPMPRFHIFGRRHKWTP